MSQPSQPIFTETFNSKAQNPKRHKSAKTSPLCIRITDRERERLEQDAGDLPLSAYVRSRLFDAAVIAPRRRMLRPVKDREALARVLGELGSARIANNLNQLARAANNGSLPFGHETARDLHDACVAVHAMRHDLLAALGMRP